MSLVRYLVVGHIVWFAFGPICAAQEEDSYRTVTRVVNLAHEHAESVVDAIEQVSVDVRAVVINSNRIVLHGMQADIDTLMTDLIAELDVPPSLGESDTGVEFFPLGSAEPNTLMSAIYAITANQSTHVALDNFNRVLVVRGSERDRRVIRRLIDELDKPSQTLSLQFFFIRAGIGTSNGATGAPLAPALKPIADTLAENGFVSPSLMAPMTVVTESGTTFKSKSKLIWRAEAGGMEENLSLYVAGEARLEPGTEVVQIELGGEVSGSFGVQGGKEGFGGVGFEVHTTITAKLGSYVVLAASPSSTARGQAIALVVRATVSRPDAAQRR